jgi:hypothetical protein
MRERYRRWMHEWEARMTSRDNNRVVRPFEWGPEWASRWPSLENFPPPQDQSDKAGCPTQASFAWVGIQVHFHHRGHERA